MTSPAFTKNNRIQAFKALACSVLVIFFLFFIDEGNFNLSWMKDGGNWIAFLIYLTGFTLGQCLTHFLILRRYKNEDRLTLTNVIGIPLGFGLVLLFFYLIYVL